MPRMFRIVVRLRAPRPCSLSRLKRRDSRARGNPRPRLCRRSAFAYEGRSGEGERGRRADEHDNPDRGAATAEPKIVTACVLIIGNEILSGRTQDENLGLPRARSERGRHPAARGAGHPRRSPRSSSPRSTMSRRRFDYVFTTGGIGPTHDDITAQCMADAFAVPLILHPDAKRLLETHYPAGHLNEARLRMAMVPRGGGAAAQPDLARPGISDRQCLCAARRAQHHAGDLRAAETPPRRRRQGA